MRVVACSGALKPSISTERVSSSSVVVRAAESVVLAPPNGKSDEIGVKSLVPYVDLDEDEDGGIGIVKFLRGKVFFITGATGFLAKGTILFLQNL